MNPKEEKEKAVWRQEKLLEIKQELQKSEIIDKFMEKTYPNSKEAFIDEYASAKVTWLEWGAKQMEWNETEDLQWLEDARKRLKEIQQKKLFDVQCLWRAEKITIDQIKLTIDFMYWEDNILNCPFIDPVSENDLEMYISYLQTGNFEQEQWFLDRWQDYEKIKEAYNDENSERNFPEWYEFHNSRTGLSAYMLFPDIRGDKEKFYRNLWSEELKKKTKEAEKEKKQEKQIASFFAPLVDMNTERRPYLNYTKKGWMTWFVNTYEDKQTQEAFQRFGGEPRFDDYDEYLANDLELLARSGKVIPITGWFDWKEAIHKTADTYRREKIIEALPSAYQQYRVSVDMNLPFETIDSVVMYWDWYRESILRGRELNGEPRDFDF